MQNGQRGNLSFITRQPGCWPFAVNGQCLSFVSPIMATERVNEESAWLGCEDGIPILVRSWKSQARK